jgi:hypothetical protein
MSATMDAPWLEKLDASDNALLDAMRADDAAPRRLPDAPAAAAMPEPGSGESGPYVEVPDDGTFDHLKAEREPDDADRRVAAAEERLRTVERQGAAELARAQERLNILTQLATAQAPAAAPAPIPDVDADPIGHFRAVSERSAREVQQLAATVRGMHEGQQRAQQMHALRQWGTNQELAFEAKEPSYRAAMAFLKQSRDEELEALGVTDPAERQRVLANDVSAIAAKAAQDRANFAERLYRTAEKRGWKAPNAAPGTKGTNQPAPRGAPARLTPEAIANLPDEQFGKLVENMRQRGPSALRALMGA